VSTSQELIRSFEYAHRHEPKSNYVLLMHDDLLRGRRGMWDFFYQSKDFLTQGLFRTAELYCTSLLHGPSKCFQIRH